jgi:prophage maintenance system killer protein
MPVKKLPLFFEGWSQNHPFLDGNKRAAITATGVFLLLNG